MYTIFLMSVKQHRNIIMELGYFLLLNLLNLCSTHSGSNNFIVTLS